MKRIFTALELSPNAKLVPAYYSLMLRETYPELAAKLFEPSRNMHITLNFLGELDDDSVDMVCDAVRSVTERTPYFTYDFGGLDIFSESKILKLPVRENMQLWLLHDELAERLSPLKNISVEWNRDYAPHVTVARFKSLTGLRFMEIWDEVQGCHHQMPGIGRFQVALDVCVLQSRRDEDGEVFYIPLERYPLKTGKYHES